MVRYSVYRLAPSSVAAPQLSMWASTLSFFSLSLSLVSYQPPPPDPRPSFTPQLHHNTRVFVLQVHPQAFVRLPSLLPCPLLPHPVLINARQHGCTGSRYLCNPCSPWYVMHSFTNKAPRRVANMGPSGASSHDNTFADASASAAFTDAAWLPRHSTSQHSSGHARLQSPPAHTFW